MTVSMKDLLEAGVHFGHQTQRWNPKMAQYLLANYDNLHLIDLERTVPLIKRAISVLDHIYKNGNYNNSTAAEMP